MLFHTHTKRGQGVMFCVRRDEFWDTRVGVPFEVLNVYFSPRSVDERGYVM